MAASPRLQLQLQFIPAKYLRKKIVAFSKNNVKSIVLLFVLPKQQYRSAAVGFLATVVSFGGDGVASRRFSTTLAETLGAPSHQGGRGGALPFADYSVRGYSARVS